MAEQHTAERLRNRMESRFGYLHYNDRYNGCHAGQYDFLMEMLADDVTEDAGSSFCVTLYISCLVTALALKSSFLGTVFRDGRILALVLARY